MNKLQVSGPKAAFTKHDDLQVIVLKSGVYKQCAVYKRENQLYAQICGGYVALSRDGVCSTPSVKWKEFVSISEAVPDIRIGNIGWIVEADSL